MNFRCKRASVRAVVLCLAALLALSLLAGCAKPNPQSVLYRRGMSVVYTMCDMASSDYLRLLYGKKAADMLDKTQEDGTTFRGQMDAAHYKTADAVFLLDATVPTSDGTTDGLSEELQELYRIQSAVGLSGYLSLNAGADSDRISLSAMLTATELFTCEGIRENTVFHYLYVFQEGLPIIVTYRTGRDGAVWASGKFLYDKGLNLTSAAELKAYMEETYKTLRDLTVERVH